MHNEGQNSTHRLQVSELLPRPRVETLRPVHLPVIPLRLRRAIVVGLDELELVLPTSVSEVITGR